MEPPSVSSGEHFLGPLTSFASIPLTRHSLAYLRSLVINPSTPISLITSIFEALSSHLERCCESLLLAHAVKLLSELAFRWPGLSDGILDRVRSRLLSTESARVAAESLDAIALVAERDETLCSSSLDGHFDSFFVSLCFGRSVSVRQWLLRNAERFGVGSHVLVTVFLGFTKDPYPCVRKAALDGLVSLSKSSPVEDRGLVEGCYYRAVELLGDVEAYVRCAAVRTVCHWGHILVASMQGTEKREQSDAIFIQLCSMIRDMSMEVRIEAFDALGKTEAVSLNNLLQSLSKKVLVSIKGNRSLCQSTGPNELSPSSVAGALVHGLEDEFNEVRRSACDSMRRLCMISSNFSGEAINLLMDMLNDDSVNVRLQALETMHHMATRDHLSLEAMHMHMFLGTLVDKFELVRAAVRKVLKFVKLRDLELLKLSVNGLIDNLEAYPQDEVDIFSALFHLGRRHGNFVACFINEVFPEIEPSSDGKLSFDCARVSALLVLSISATIFAEQNIGAIPPRAFSYAITLLGRISYAVRDITSQNALLAYFSQGSSCMNGNISESGEHVLPNMDKDGVASLASDQKNDLDQFPLGDAKFECSKMYAQKFWQPTEEPKLTAQLQIHDDLIKSLNFIFTKVKANWPLVKAGFTSEVLKMLR